MSKCSALDMLNDYINTMLHVVHEHDETDRENGSYVIG